MDSNADAVARTDCQGKIAAQLHDHHPAKPPYNWCSHHSSGHKTSTVRSQFEQTHARSHTCSSRKAVHPWELLVFFPFVATARMCVCHEALDRLAQGDRQGKQAGEPTPTAAGMHMTQMHCFEPLPQIKGCIRFVNQQNWHHTRHQHGTSVPQGLQQ